MGVVMGEDHLRIVGLDIVNVYVHKMKYKSNSWISTIGWCM